MIRLKYLQAENFKALRSVDLGFPEVGSVLIEGLNESGKSTLFESVYFALYGRPLVANIEHTVRYQTQEAFVELGLMVDATELVITRSVRMGRPNRAKLTVTRPGEPPEVITQLSAVNKRVVQELGRLDGDTLLNSCFVEQKKLQRLEGLDPASRQDSLLRLLNLEGLGVLESRFKVKVQDTEAITRASDRYDLARIQAKIPVTEAQEALANRRLAAVRIRAGLDRIDGYQDEIGEHQFRRKELRSQQARLQTDLNRIVQLAQVDASVGGIIQAQIQREGAAARQEALVAEIAEIVRVRDIDLPELLRHLAAIQALAADLDQLEAVESGLAAVRGGAAHWAEAVAEDARAERLEADCLAMGEQLARVVAVQQLLQQIDESQGRIKQRDQVAQTIAELESQEERLQALKLGLPMERERVMALTQAADALTTAEAKFATATRAREMAAAFRDAIEALSQDQAAHKSALEGLSTLTLQVAAAEKELQDAQAARARATGPALRAWIAAREDEDRAQKARDDEAQKSAEFDGLELVRTSSELAAAAAARRLVVLAGTALAGTALGIGMFIAGASVVGTIVFVLALLAAGFAIRAHITSGSLRAAAAAVRSESVKARQELTEARAIISASGTSGRDRLGQAEDMLRALDQTPPSDIASAKQMLLAARDQDIDAENAQERVRVAQAKLRDLNQAQGAALARVNDARNLVQATEERAEKTRAEMGANVGDDPARLASEALQRLVEARQQLATAIETAATFLADPTPQGLRVQASSAQRRIQEAEADLNRLVDVNDRLETARKQMAGLAEHISTDRALIEKNARDLGATDTSDLDSIRSYVAQLRTGTSEPELRRSQAILNTNLGGTRAAAEQHRRQATSLLQQARDQASRIGVDQSGAVADLAGAILRISTPMLEEFVELGRLAELASAERRALVGRATELNEPPDLGRLKSAIAEIAIEQRHMQTRIDRLPDFEVQLANIRAALKAADNEISTAWTGIEQRLVVLGLGSPDHDPSALRTSLQSEIRRLDEPAKRSSLDSVIAEGAAVDAAIQQRETLIAEEERLVKQQLSPFGCTGEAVDRPAIEQVLPEIRASDLPDEQAVLSELAHLVGELSYLRRTRTELESALDLIGIVIDVAEAEVELGRAKRARLVKQRATNIIKLARDNMISRVLPGTEHNLRLLLPQLTADRYCDAQLDSTYKLTVWDSAAQRYIEKDIFSGGTRDQFSLALRLAFALATLPQELGTTPGFIFLDEPLSAFDQPRTGALVDLLTRGQIARSFAQIFLISHSRSFDPRLFAYYVRMEDGRVAETNLPSRDTSPTQSSTMLLDPIPQTYELPVG